MSIFTYKPCKNIKQIIFIALGDLILNKISPILMTIGVVIGIPFFEMRLPIRISEMSPMVPRDWKELKQF